MLRVCSVTYVASPGCMGCWARLLPSHLCAWQTWGLARISVVHHRPVLKDLMLHAAWKASIVLFCTTAFLLRWSVQCSSAHMLICISRVSIPQIPATGQHEITVLNDWLVNGVAFQQHTSTTPVFAPDLADQQGHAKARFRTSKPRHNSRI
jgi:hypothetical protein